MRHFPKPEPKAFAYQYQDAQDFASEIDEWFSYTKLDQERDYLLAAREAFEESWQFYCLTVIEQSSATWLDVDPQHRAAFLSKLKPQLEHEDITERQRAIACLLYVLSGIWTITAGLDQPASDDQAEEKPVGNLLQIEWMHKNVDLFIDLGLLAPLFECMQTALELPLLDIQGKQSGDKASKELFDDPQWCEISLCYSCFYIILESARSRLSTPSGPRIREQLLSLRPNFLVFMTRTIAQLRWDERYNIPLRNAVQILWKAILLAFGDTKNDLERVKGILQPRVDPFSADACKPILTASPLDYHLFRQEITSKYPAYNPPLPLIPLETDQRSILPPLPNHARTDGFDAFHKANHSNGSIMHQPVHIATPAPSPPPSPAGPGGKGGKKQNYQTNQNFPFLYPPLDSDSNNIGGKGSTVHQDASVGRKWEGSDIPTSILEAGELFASRMRMTRAMRQLWKERDLFMKYDRGWSGNGPKGTEPLDEHKRHTAEEDKLQDPELQNRMDTVEDYFHYALPDLQSLVIVLMKLMLTNVQGIASRNSLLQENQSLQSALNRSKSSQNLNNAPNAIPNPPSPPRPHQLPLEQLDDIRCGEVSQRAISACLFLMLKWFKASHVLKFEYLTQLLLDSNYIQLTLKYFAHQNLEELVSFRYDLDELSFWRYCQVHSDHPPLSPTDQEHHSDDEADQDEAVPPPIQRHRRSPTSASEDQQAAQVTTPTSPPNPQGVTVMSPQPLVDELGNPLTEFPAAPLSSSAFSTRHLHTSISLLRVLQKVTRAKSHRVLLLVSFKSAQILRRILRVPEPMLRLYVLKLFKSQVPYCGRKWRQSNMRVITAIYLHCRPELRDEWLAGLHDAAPGAGMGAPGQEGGGDYEEAVPLEWGLRGLTFWWMKRTYPDVMKAKGERNKRTKTDNPALGDSEQTPNPKDEEGAGQDIDDTERDFFKRELDAIGWGLSGINVSNGDEEPDATDDAPVKVNGAGPGVNGSGGRHPQQRGQDYGPHSEQWASESPNAEHGQNTNVTTWQ